MKREIVMPTYWRTFARGALVCLLGLLLAPLAMPPVAAGTRAGEIDAARIDSFVGEQVRRHGLPGLALGIVEGDRIVHLQGFGRADGDGRPVTPQTPFLLASVSKPLTATAIMQLVEAGRVELDAPVRRYLTDFRMADPEASGRITVRQLLQHTSGIPITSCDTRADATTLAEFAAELRTVDLAAEPGARHSYCSGNYNLLGRIVEVVSGQSFGDYMQRGVFAPLAMGRSFASEQEAERAGLAQGHRWLFGVTSAAHERYNTSQLPSGYLISSAEDMTHFLIAQLNDGRFGDARVLAPEGIAAMQAPGVSVGPGAGEYGLGWKTAPLGGVPVLQHYGDNFFYHGLVFIDPTTRRGAVLLMNGNSLLAGATAFREIEAGVARLLAGQEPAPASALTIGQVYLIVDLVLAGLFALVLWSLLGLRRWAARLAERRRAGRPRLPLLALRLLWELGLPPGVLVGVRLLFGIGLGAQSWAEIFAVIPDFAGWLWALALLMLLTGVLRAALGVRALHPDARVRARPAVKTHLKTTR